MSLLLVLLWLVLEVFFEERGDSGGSLDPTPKYAVLLVVVQVASKLLIVEEGQEYSFVQQFDSSLWTIWVRCFARGWIVQTTQIFIAFCLCLFCLALRGYLSDCDLRDECVLVPGGLGQ